MGCYRFVCTHYIYADTEKNAIQMAADMGLVKGDTFSHFEILEEVPTANSKYREYILGCLAANEEVTEQNLHKDEKFVETVIDQYTHLLRYTSDEYSEINAKDDAIKYALAFWEECLDK